MSALGGEKQNKKTRFRWLEAWYTIISKNVSDVKISLAVRIEVR